MRRWFSVLLAVAFADVGWVMYIRWIAAREHVAAALAAVILVLLGAYVTISYVGDRKYLVPASIGAFLGTLVSSMWLT